MAKWLGLALVVVVAVFAWYFVRTTVRYTAPWDQPKFGEVSRCDIRVPITAAGLIEPNQRIEIKSKASGEVIDIPVVEGDFVHTGDVLIVLKKDDEQRLADRAQAELDRVEALLAQAEVLQKEAVENVTVADAHVAELEAQLERAEFDLNKTRALRESGTAHEQELVYAATTYKALAAQAKAARSAAKNACYKIDEANAAIELQKAALRSATKMLEDAQERLSETTVVSKHDAIVTDVAVQVGTLIRSGTQDLMGGTVVMILADVSKLKVIARVDEADYGRVLDIAPIDARPDMPGLREAARQDKDSGNVKLAIDAFPEEEFEGVIERVEPQGKHHPTAAIIQYDVHVEITDPQKYKLPLGTQAQVEFTVESVEEALAVPAEAVTTYRDERGVWIKTDPDPDSREKWGREFLRCRFGITDGAYTEVLAVLDGKQLEEGQDVYTRLPVDREEEKRD
ncbi:MAG TPA: biotin/lipoyl-binding protein [Phycisphaerae bacterium]|nr:biotin/lipoyl-binding protein [Phycisphaerae bacterium]